MSAKDVVLSYFEALNRHDLDAAAGHLDPEIVEEITGVGIFRGPDEVRRFFDGLMKAVPDLQVVAEQTIAEGDSVAVRWRMNGNFTGGPLFNGVQATGGRLELRGCDVLRVSPAGKITSNNAYQDGIELARTLGMMPPAESPAEKAMIAAFNTATKVRTAVRDRFGG
jgi:ketosteroid isomerase-like protein